MSDLVQIGEQILGCKEPHYPFPNKPRGIYVETNELVAGLLDGTVSRSNYSETIDSLMRDHDIQIVLSIEENPAPDARYVVRGFFELQQYWAREHRNSKHYRPIRETIGERFGKKDLLLIHAESVFCEGKVSSNDVSYCAAHHLVRIVDWLYKQRGDEFRVVLVGKRAYDTLYLFRNKGVEVYTTPHPAARRFGIKMALKRLLPP